MWQHDGLIFFAGKRGRNEKLASRGKTSREPEAVKERLLKKANAFVNGRPGFIIRMNKSYIVLDRTVVCLVKQ